jgi:hypothetical protein
MKKYENAAKYEILMHQKFLEAQTMLQTKMAPDLIAYNNWQLNNKSKIVGWVSEKLELLLVTYLQKQQKPKDIKAIFDKMQIYFENMCKAGLWHYDGHLGNWGFSKSKDLILFDYEYASDGHDRINCKWMHEINLLAYGIRETHIEKQNLRYVIVYMNQLHQNLFKLQPKTMKKAPKINYDDPLKTLEYYPKDVSVGRIEFEEQTLYVNEHVTDWQPK